MDKVIEINNTGDVKVRLLIVCTNMNNAAFSNAVFGDLDCAVTITANPQHALTLFRDHLTHNNPFDAVFLDYRLTGTDGITLAGKLKAMAPGIKLFFFFSWFLHDAAVENSYRQLFGYHKKPIESFEQIEIITYNLKRTKSKSLQGRNPDYETQ